MREARLWEHPCQRPGHEHLSAALKLACSLPLLLKAETLSFYELLGQGPGKYKVSPAGCKVPVFMRKGLLNGRTEDLPEGLPSVSELPYPRSIVQMLLVRLLELPKPCRKLKVRGSPRRQGAPRVVLLEHVVQNSALIFLAPCPLDPDLVGASEVEPVPPKLFYVNSLWCYDDQVSMRMPVPLRWFSVLQVVIKLIAEEHPRPIKGLS